MIDPKDPGDAVLAFLAERHLATLTTLRADGSYAARSREPAARNDRVAIEIEVDRILGRA